ncbi:MAG: hypothetical protein J6I76_11095 [Oribacterium sp.]|nr:hypothetical protein [Oribacterium sp.]
MRKQLVILVCFILLVALMCGCSKKNAVAEEGTSAKSNIVETTPAVQKTVESQLTVVDTTMDKTMMETTAEKKPKIEWQGLNYRWEDASGYVFEATIEMSPWINTKNRAYLDYAWIDAGMGFPLPEDTLDSWGIERGSAGYGRSGNSVYGSFKPLNNITDIYYCVGTIGIINRSVDWNFNTPLTSDSIWFSACQTEVQKVAPGQQIDQMHYYQSHTVSDVLYSNGQVKNSTWAKVNPVYTSKSWGPVPFVFAHFENKTPNCPKGEYRSEMENTYFYINGQSYCIWEKEMSELNYVKLDIIE